MENNNFIKKKKKNKNANIRENNVPTIMNFKKVKIFENEMIFDNLTTLVSI